MIPVNGYLFALTMALLKVNAAVIGRGTEAVQTELGAFFCNDINWANNCAHWKNLNSGSCYTLDASHQDSLSSFGPDSGTYCFLYADYSCGSSNAYIAYPGSGDLRNVYYAPEPGVEYPVNDDVNSFQCYASS